MKKLILSIAGLVMVSAVIFYFWDMKKEVSDIKKTVEQQIENKTVSENKSERKKSDTRKINDNYKDKSLNSIPDKLNNRENLKQKVTKGKNSIAMKIDELTEERRVISYLKENKKLPDYYITKKEAQNNGWIAKKGNLCQILPGRAIGGDIFTNREKSLPVKKGRIWYEADLNYNCGNRNAQRIVFSNDGLIFVTHDHYRNFEEVK